MRERAVYLRQLQRAQKLYITAMVYKGGEREYLGVVQGLSDAYCEVKILQEKIVL